MYYPKVRPGVGENLPTLEAMRGSSRPTGYEAEDAAPTSVDVVTLRRSVAGHDHTRINTAATEARDDIAADLGLEVVDDTFAAKLLTKGMSRIILSTWRDGLTNDGRRRRHNSSVEALGGAMNAANPIVDTQLGRWVQTYSKHDKTYNFLLILQGDAVQTLMDDRDNMLATLAPTEGRLLPPFLRKSYSPRIRIFQTGDIGEAAAENVAQRFNEEGILKDVHVELQAVETRLETDLLGK